LSAAGATLVAVAVGSAALAQLSADDRKCTDAVYKSARNIGNQEQKNDGSCVKNATGGAGDDACVDAEGAKAAGKRPKLTDLFAAGGKCETPPAFGVNTTGGGNDIADAIEDGADNIVRGVFGDPVDGLVNGDKCQQAIAKRTGKKYDTALKAFRGCAKSLAAVNAIADLNGCVSTAVNDAKVTGVQGKLAGDITKKCTTFPPAGAEDGDCSSCATDAACATCIGNIVDCESCRAMNKETGGSADCDLVDDGLANGSCGGCALAAGRYTQTTVAGGTLRVATFAEFPFPAGGSTIQDVSAGDANCVHTTTVPYPGGLTVPVFCVPALGATTSVTQSGCGVGRIDSNGGSDFTVKEDGDTSELTVCGVLQGVCPASGPAPDSSGRLDITVGDGIADTCGGGTANAIVTIPVNTLTWVAADTSCPDSDGTYNVGTDTQLAAFPQTLDLTTDTATARFTDISGDGCAKSGLGPNGPFSKTGACIDTGAGTVTVAAAGTIFSSGGPTYDLLFSTRQPATISGPTAGSSSCGSPPLINFGGLASRCLVGP